MAGEFGIVHPLWDFAADDGRLLEQVAGDVGISHVTIPVVTGAQTQFRLGSGGEAPHFHTEGGWHFRARTKAYAAAALKPPKARWFAGGDVLARARERAAEFDMQLLLRVDVRAVRALVDQQRHLCQRNAWGQEVPFAGACACNPDLRELLRATFDDLGRYDPAGYELIDWVPDCAADRAADRPFRWHARARRLLDICFCASCRQVAQRADVDPDAAARSVRVLVEQQVSAPAVDVAALEEDPVVAAYIAARVTDCRQWLRHVPEGDPDYRRLLVQRHGDPAFGNCAPWVRLVRVPLGTQGPIAGEHWDPLLRLLSETSALAVPVWRPTFSTAAELVRFVSEAVGAGVRTLDFEGLNEAAPEAITWLKQAVRFARRG